MSDTPEEVYVRGIKCLKRGAWEEAAATFRKLILIAPGFRDAEQRLDEAKRKLRKIEDLEDLYRIGKAHLEKGQWETAVDCLKRIVASGEDYKDSGSYDRDNF